MTKRTDARQTTKVPKERNKKDIDLPCTFKGHSGVPVISEAMRDVLARLNPGFSLFLECPLYGILPSSYKFRAEADRTKQEPRRWLLFTVSETKVFLDLDRSTGLRAAPFHPGVFSPYEDQNLTVNHDVPLSGALIWYDPNLRAVHF